MTHKQNGFTLIEIIVVLIIVGVLSAIALVNIFSWINRSRAAEALASMGSYKNQIEACVQTHPGQESVCPHFTFPVSPNFQYTFQGCVVVSGGMVTGSAGNRFVDNCPDWEITASQTFADRINLLRTGGETTSPTITCSGENAFTGVC